MQFPLLRRRRDPETWFFGALIAAMAIAGTVHLVLGLVGVMIWEDAAPPAVILIGYALTFPWLLLWFGTGFAEITESHLIIHRKRSRTERYRLDDIADAQVKRAYWGRVPFVELKLRRSLIIGVWSARSGTDIAGIPTVFLKRARVLVQNPAAFAEELRRRLPTAGASQTGA